MPSRRAVPRAVTVAAAAWRLRMAAESTLEGLTPAPALPILLALTTRP